LTSLAGLLLACGPAPPPPEVEYSGCRIVSVPGPICALWLEKPQLKVWVGVDHGSDVEIFADGERLHATGVESQGGLRFTLKIRPDTSSLTVRLRQREGPPGPPWSLKLVSPAKPRWQTEAERLAASGREGEFRKRLSELLKHAPRKGRGRLYGMLGVQAQADGYDDEAATWLRRGILADHQEGLLSEEIDKATILAFILMEDGRFAEARRVLPDPRELAGAPAGAQYEVAYKSGLLADGIGDYRSALESLRQASDLAERVGLFKSRLDSEQVRARLLQEVGRSKEALGIFASLPALLDLAKLNGTAGPCDEASLLINEAWSSLLAGEGGERTEDPIPALKRAENLYDGPCPQPAQQLNVRLNLALAYQQAQRLTAARKALNEAKAPALASHVKLDERLWWLDLEGRQAIATGDPGGALAFYDRLAVLAREAQSTEGGFRAAVGRAHAQEKLGRPAEAIASFQQADRFIDEETLHIPAYEGRDSFVAQRELEMRRYLQLLLDHRLQHDAFDLVRRDRSRLLRQLAVRDRLANLTDEEKQRWERSLSNYWALRAVIDHEAAQEGLLPGDELKLALERKTAQLDKARKELDLAMAELSDPRTLEEGRPSPPAPGEVILAYHPLPQGWVGFAADSTGIQAVATFDLPENALAHPRELQSLAALAPRLLGPPFEAVIQRARLVRVLPFGPLRLVDFHALPFAQATLLAKVPVVYGLDLPTHLSTAPAGRPVALLVANPENNLPEAEKESKIVADTVRGWGRGWNPERLDNQDASEEAVRQALLGADLFDFAGHGVFEESGWDSALLLAAGSRLTPRDLLTLKRVPSWVVLSTCGGGLSSKEAPGEGIGLAQAFLLAGSRAVVASTRPVRDTEARAFVEELYRRWKPGMDLAQPFQRAQLACRQRNPAGDWASFRLFEP
jgi:tetratricopeptide (TPR) repeat protein